MFGDHIWERIMKSRKVHIETPAKDTGLYKVEMSLTHAELIALVVTLGDPGMWEDDERTACSREQVTLLEPIVEAFNREMLDLDITV